MSGLGRVYNTASFSLQMHMDTLTRMQEQISTGTRVIRPSDDPNDAHRIMQLRAQAENWENYTNNLGSVELNLQGASSALQEVSSLLSRARELVTQAANATYGPDTRSATADEINGLLEQALSRANHSSLGQYIFGGAKISTKPFEVREKDGKIIGVSYQGSRHELRIPIAPGVTQSGLLVGERVFQNQDRQDPVFFGNTGVAGGKGTSTVTGNLWLTIQHTTTDYTAGAASGVVAGTDSASGDTILGDHTITIVAADGTIRLDNGQEVVIADAADPQNLQLINENGDIAYVDVSGYGGVWDGNFTIAAGGTMPVNGGVDTVNIDFASDTQKVTDSETGKLLYVDSTGISRVGAEAVRVPGTYDVFETLIHLRDVLKNERGLSVSDQTLLLDKGLAAIEESMEGIGVQLTVVGSRLQATDKLKYTLDSLKANANMEIASLEDADIVSLAVKLARGQTLYQMALQTASKLLSLSLLDFIR